MMCPMKRVIYFLLASFMLTSCGIMSSVTRESQYAKMYEEKPITLLVMPPINNSANVEANREQMWELNQANFTAGTFGNPQELTTLIRYWQAQEEAHYPGARRQVEFFQRRYQEQQMMAQMQQQAAQTVQWMQPT